MPLSPGLRRCPQRELRPELLHERSRARHWLVGAVRGRERLTASAGPPEVPGGYPSEVELYVATADGGLPKWDKQVACAAYPGTVAYTFLAGGDYEWYCHVPNADVTWTVNYGFAPPFNPAGRSPI
jgi:hypothetical protein